MTTRDPNDLRDARVDAAWRAASREEPPAKLDDAIRAAARREIGARPRPADARKGLPESLRPERWWWPLAAAATIGAITVGLLQIGEPDQAGAPGADKIVSDTPAMPEQAKKQDATPPVESDAARQAPAAKLAAPVAPPAATPPSKARESVAPASPPAPVSASSPPGLRKDVAVPFPRDEGAAARDASPSSAIEPRSAANAAANTAATPAPAVAQPFPADAVKRESKETTMRDAASASGIVAPSAAPADTPKPFAEDKLATAPAEPGRAEPAREAQRSTQEGAQRAQPQSAARRVQEAEAAPGFATANASKPQAQASVAAREKVAPKLPVPDWIALIRKLRDEGKTDEAAKELTAFRSAYDDHERLLPPDLRDWKPAAR